jgi:membrane protease YdiL (CAAX protease family)
MPREPVSAWILWTAVSVPLIGIGLYLAAQTGLGAPLLEGLLERGEIRGWARQVIALTVLITIVTSVPFLLVNLNVDPETYPPSWMLFLASIDAGVQEEIFMRLVLVSFLAWLGGLMWRDPDGRPARPVMWGAILLSGFLFGLGHVDNVTITPEILGRALAILSVNAILGLVFGWLYWRQGLESAILAHFLIDAVGSGIVIPAYVSRNPVVMVLTTVGLGLVGLVAWQVLRRGRQGRCASRPYKSKK